MHGEGVALDGCAQLLDVVRGDGGAHVAQPAFDLADTRSVERAARRQQVAAFAAHSLLGGADQGGNNDSLLSDLGGAIWRGTLEASSLPRSHSTKPPNKLRQADPLPRRLPEPKLGRRKRQPQRGTARHRQRGEPAGRTGNARRHSTCSG